MSRRHFLSTPLALGPMSLMSPLADVHARLPEAGTQQALTLPLAGGQAPQPGWLHLPPGYGDAGRAESTAGWPLVIFLHGSGERGDDLARVLAHGPPRHAAQGRRYPFVLFSPLLPANDDWDPARLRQLVLALQARLQLDPARTCATGLSRGGHGVWRWATAYPQDLAAIAPVCGFGDPAAVCRARAVPVRAYHGDADGVVPLARQQACVDALRACGGEVSFTVYPGVGHDAWNPAYDDPGLVPWLMAQRRR